MNSSATPKPPAYVASAPASPQYTSSAQSMFGSAVAAGQQQANVAQSKRRSLIGGAS